MTSDDYKRLAELADGIEGAGRFSFTGDYVLLPSMTKRDRDLVATALRAASVKAGEVVAVKGEPVDHNEQAYADLRASGGIFPEAYQQSTAPMTDEQIRHMVDRFLMWKLPEHFNPDCGISFDPKYRSDHGPVGTNLFDYTQATAMVRHMVEGMPTPTSIGAMREALVHTLASLAAAISLLERTPKAKKVAPSDKMFDQMIVDYKNALEAGRTAALAAASQSDGPAPQSQPVATDQLAGANTANGPSDTPPATQADYITTHFNEVTCERTADCAWPDCECPRKFKMEGR